MHREIQMTDAKGRLVLPDSFANATVMVEQVFDSEIRVRIIEGKPEEEFRFAEEIPAVLSSRERDRFLELLENPPAPTPALEKAADRYRRRCINGNHPEY